MLRRKVKTMNEDQFNLLFQQFQQDVYRMAFTYVRNSDDALDIVQEVAYRAYKHVNSVKNDEYIKTWLLRITINCSLDLIRKRNKSAKEIEAVKTNAKHAERDLDVSLKVSLEDILDRLQFQEKTVVYLKYYQQHTFEEIADIMELPPSTVKSINYRGLKKLRNYIDRGEMYGGEAY